MAGFLYLSALALVVAYFSCANGAGPKILITPSALAGHLGEQLRLNCAADAAPAGARLCWYALERSGERRRLLCVTGATSLEFYLTLTPREAGLRVLCVLQQVGAERALAALAESHDVPITIYNSTDAVRLSPAGARVLAAEPGDRVRIDCEAAGAPGAKFAHVLVIRPGNPTYSRMEYSKAFKVSNNDNGAEVSCVFRQESPEPAQATLRSRAVTLAVHPAAPAPLVLDVVNYQGEFRQERPEPAHATLRSRAVTLAVHPAAHAPLVLDIVNYQGEFRQERPEPAHATLRSRAVTLAVHPAAPAPLLLDVVNYQDEFRQERPEPAHATLRSRAVTLAVHPAAPAPLLLDVVNYQGEFRQERPEPAHATLRSRAVTLAVHPAAPAPLLLDVVNYQGAPNLTLSRKKKITNVEESSESSSDEDSDETPARAPTVGFGDVYDYKCRADRIAESARLCLYQLDKGRDKKTEKLTCEHNAQHLFKKFFLTNSARDSRVVCVAQVFDSARQAFVTIAASAAFTVTFTRQSNTRVLLRPEGEVTVAAGDRLRLACQPTGLPRRARLVWLETGGSEGEDHVRITKVDSRRGAELRPVRAADAGAALQLQCAARDRDSAARRPADLARSHELTVTVIDDGLKRVEKERTELYVSYGARNVTVATRGRVQLTCHGAHGARLPQPPANCLAWLQTRRDQSRVLLSAACGGAREVSVTLAATAADAGSALHCAALRDLAGQQEVAHSDAIPIIVQ